MIDHLLFSKVVRDDKQLQDAFQSLTRGLVITSKEFPLEIIVQRFRKKRSDQANRYLWGVVYAIISQETGNDVNDLHLYFCGEFFGWEDYEVMGMTRKRPRETSRKQIKARFSEFLEFIISKAAELGIVIPPPNHELPEDMK